MTHFDERIRFYRTHATELRQFAERWSELEAKAELLGLSMQYDRLAEGLERRHKGVGLKGSPN